MGVEVEVFQSLADIQKQSRDWASSRRSPFGLPIPRVALRVDVFGFATTSAGYGTQVLLVEFKVRANWFFLATGIVLSFSGTGNAPGPGDVAYQIDVDRPLGRTSGYVEKNYNAVPFELGDFQRGPQWDVEFKHRNLEVIRIKGTPIANMGVSGTDFLTASLSGWEWPEGGDEL